MARAKPPNNVVFVLGTPASRFVIHARCQHPVGQGGLHSGILVGPDDHGAAVWGTDGVTAFGAAPFRYVYDCGSRHRTACRAAIRGLVAEASQGSRLDYLFLSHFDADHVNCVPDLVDMVTGLRPATIVMPWVDDVERVIAWAKAVAERRDERGFYASLVVNPAGTLARSGRDRVIFIRGGEAPGGEPVSPEPSGPEDGGFRSKIRRDDPHDGDRRPRGTVAHVARSEVLTLDHGAAIEVAGGGPGLGWLLKPYVRDADPAAVLAFERSAEGRLGWAYGSFRASVGDASVRERLVGDPEQSRRLAAAYKDAFRDRNLTSMSLFSGPDHSQGKPSLMGRLAPGGAGRLAKVGWLGTGDVRLAAPSEAQAFLRHFDEQRDGVSTFALPHHGALRNHSKHVLEVLRPDICLASAQPPRNWQHPHCDVMSDAAAAGALPVHVSGDPATRLEEVFMIMA